MGEPSTIKDCVRIIRKMNVIWIYLHLYVSNTAACKLRKWYNNSPSIYHPIGLYLSVSVIILVGFIVHTHAIISTISIVIITWVKDTLYLHKGDTVRSKIF
jgi:hypothetical protein